MITKNFPIHVALFLSNQVLVLMHLVIRFIGTLFGILPSPNQPSFVTQYEDEEDISEVIFEVPTKCRTKACIVRKSNNLIRGNL